MGYLLLRRFVGNLLDCAVSFFTLTVISEDRLLALLLGLRYRQVVTCLILFNNNLFMDFVHFRCIYFVLESSYYFTMMVSIRSNSFLFSDHNVRLHLKFMRHSQIHNQIHVQNHVVQAQQSRVIPLNIARYRKAVNSALWVQVTLVVCYLLYGITVIGVRTGGGGEGGCSPPKFWATQIFWAAREIWAKLVFKEACKCLCIFFEEIISVST